MDVIFEILIGLLLLVSALVGIAFLTYYVACRIIVKVCKVENEDAEELIAMWLTRNMRYDLSLDTFFIEEVSETVRAIIGDERYAQLIKLARTSQLIQFTADGCRCVAVVVPYVDENEKARAGNLLKKVLVNCLSDHKQFSQVLVDWKEHRELKMPYIMLRYASNVRENAYIRGLVERENREIVQKYQPLTDEDNLHEE